MGAQEERRKESVEGFELGGANEDEGRSEDGYSQLAVEDEEEEGSSSSLDSILSLSSIDSSDMGEDASSSCSTSPMLRYSSSNSSSSVSLSNGRGPLYELSELMSQLPMKRGLSKYYDGRSQSYTSLASVKSIEDLQKKESIISTCSGRKRLKLCRSYVVGLDNSVISPKAAISEKDPK